MGSKALLDLKDLMVTQELRVQLVVLALMEAWGLQVELVHKVLADRWVNQGLPEPKAHQAQMVHLAILVRRVIKVHQGQLAQRGLLELLGTQDQQDSRASVEAQETRDSLVS